MVSILIEMTGEWGFFVFLFLQIVVFFFLRNDVLGFFFLIV